MLLSSVSDQSVRLTASDVVLYISIQSEYSESSSVRVVSFKAINSLIRNDSDCAVLAFVKDSNKIKNATIPKMILLANFFIIPAIRFTCSVVPKIY